MLSVSHPFVDEHLHSDPAVREERGRDARRHRRVVDGAVNALSTAALAGGRRLGRLQTGRINNYVLGITLGVVILVAISWFAT